MIILGDKTKSNGRIPWTTFSLIAVNIVVYSLQCFLGESFTLGFSLVPKEIATLTDLTKPEQIHAKVPVRTRYGRIQTGQYRDAIVTIPHAPGPFPIVLTLVTSMFLHGNLLHLVGNMWFLGVFGRNVECAWNHGRFLALYVACGVIGGLVYTASNPSSVVPCLGASGAISGIMGAYVAIYPLNPISIWFGFFIGVLRIPAVIVLGIWFVFQYLSAFQALELAGASLGGTAYWDHLGGFLAGVGITWSAYFYLKKLATAADLPSPEKEAEIAAILEENAREVADEPYRACLPQSPAKQGSARSNSHVKKSDPFAACLPSSTAVKCMEHS